MTRRTRLDEHPTVQAVRARPAPPPPAVLDAAELRALCLAAGADDVGFVEIERPALADQVEDITAAFPRPRALVSLVCRTNREAVRSPARSVGNLEFHQTYDRTNEVARDVVTALEARGVRAMNPSVGFPMELDRWPGKIWVVGHKPVAVEAGLGRMGLHRNVIHPRFGNFILLATLVLDTPVSAYDRPLDYNPCLECKLCVAACPTGAISKTGEFDFSACATHNYRDFLTGFGDWVETVASSSGPADYRGRVSDPETVSMWQSLAFSPQYKAAYCVSVCPAGEDVIGPYLDDRRAHLDDVVKPLQDKVETVYVVAGGDPEDFVPRRFPHKRVQRVGLGIRPASVAGFVQGMPLLFQRGAARDLDARYHLVFTGSETREVTVQIRRGTLEVTDGRHGRPDLVLRADADTWLRFLGGRASLPVALARGRLRLRGNPRLLAAFARCFPT
jgi:ferredoxin